MRSRFTESDVPSWVLWPECAGQRSSYTRGQALDIATLIFELRCEGWCRPSSSEINSAMRSRFTESGVLSWVLGPGSAGQFSSYTRGQALDIAILISELRARCRVAYPIGSKYPIQKSDKQHNVLHYGVTTWGHSIFNNCRYEQ